MRASETRRFLPEEARGSPAAGEQLECRSSIMLMNKRCILIRVKETRRNETTKRGQNTLAKDPRRADREPVNGWSM
ncbi:hypothetical protein C0674_04475 [Sporolactobacillus terrae]|uniref:Uncharacterized protein n=1 Tax=Sporolactobacillus terrae TaxID=269673 RepID=A0ABX5Q5M9_9BACL|nr:hypothetical protein C0674_04475 [Sporolactobacillus terrae]QAA24903.1 hypothetical protein C0679_04450 [Sporolactobacillus terrae]